MVRYFHLPMVLILSSAALLANPQDGLELLLTFDEPEGTAEIKDTSGKNRHGLTNETHGDEGRSVTQTSAIAPAARYRFLTQKFLSNRPVDASLIIRREGETPLVAGTDFEVGPGGIRLLREDIPPNSKLRYTYYYENPPLLHEAGIKGGALAFDGINDWVDIALDEPIDVSSGLTIAAWIHPEKRTAPIELLFSVGGEWGISFYENTLAFLYAGAFLSSDAKTDRVTFKNFTRPTDDWTHIAVVTNGSDVRLYVNGIETEVASGVLAGVKPSSTQPTALRIGGGMSYNYHGRIDDLRIYNRALSAEEITKLSRPAE